MHDLVIRNATIVDGTGAPGIRGDVGVFQGRIVEVGQVTQAGREDVDAQGLVLMPGIIDSHTHYDAQITWDPFATPSVGLGVTTVVMGNCGFTIAPCRPEQRDLTLRNLTQVEGMSLEALVEGTRWNFTTFPEYLNAVEDAGVVPNVAAFCGHSSLRTWVMGEEATQREATNYEIRAMSVLLKEALRAGAIGFATSTFEGHNGAGGVPMPSRMAGERELHELNAVLGEEGHGLFMLTKGRNTRIAFLESLAAESQRPVVIAALQYDHANPSYVFNDLKAIGEARGRNRPLYGQVGCTPVTFEFTLDAAYLFEGMAAWRPAIALYKKPAELAALYADPAFREAVKTELVQPGSLNRFTDQWHLMEVIEAAKPEHADTQLRNVAELAQAAGKHPLDWLLDFGIAEDFGTLFSVQVLNADEEQVVKLLQDPNTTIALSDAGAHLSLFCDAGFGLYLLGRWVRERGELPLEQAVHYLTGQPAQIFGIPERGRIEPGYWADLLLFDPATVHRGPKSKAYDLPTGAVRLTTPGVGLHGTWINGVRVAGPDGVLPTSERPGQVLREFAS